jgi:hypothetical protein
VLSFVVEQHEKLFCQAAFALVSFLMRDGRFFEKQQMGLAKWRRIAERIVGVKPSRGQSMEII